jgi:glyoxylase-like metal-dependent hydrolase (beta-lactamase superfamily II)
MTEPREIAAAADEVAPGLWTWSISNSSIGGHTSTSQALLTREGCVLIDPVRLDDAALAGLPRPLATLLTSRGHQRAAWRYRRELGAEVWLPEDASAADEQPDHTYADGQLLPGGLRAFRTPGPEWPHYSFLYEGDPGVVFCSDLVSSDEEGLHFINPAFHEDPEATRASVEQLLGLPFGILCFAHGDPVVDEPKAALRALLEHEG